MGLVAAASNSPSAPAGALPVQQILHRFRSSFLISGLHRPIGS